MGSFLSKNQKKVKSESASSDLNENEEKNTASTSGNCDNREAEGKSNKKNTSNKILNIIGNTTDTLRKLVTRADRTTDNYKSIQCDFPLVKDDIIKRKAEVKALYKLMTSRDRKPVLITGPGGAGKTSLAIHCACTWLKDKSKTINNIALLNAENLEVFTASVVTKVDVSGFGCKEINYNLKKLFNIYAKQKSLLIIYDNLDSDSEVIVKNYLPDSSYSNIYVIGTSRLNTFNSFFKIYPLEMISDSDAMVLFKNEFKRFDDNDEILSKSLTELLELLGGLPVAIVLAAAYIRTETEAKYRTCINDIIEKYIQNIRVHLVKKMSLNCKTNYKKNVFACLETNINKIKSKCGKTIIYCLAHLDATGVDVRIIELLEPEYSEDEINEAIQDLLNYSLIKRISAKWEPAMLTMHRLIREVARGMEYEDRNKELKCLCTLIIEMQWPGRHWFTVELSFTEADTKILLDCYKTYMENMDMKVCLIDSFTKLNCDIAIVANWTAVHYAAYFRHYDITRWLVNSLGVDFAMTVEKWTVCHSMALFYYNCCYGLLNISDMIDVQIVHGLTPLHIASALGYWETVDWLIEQRCDVNLCDNEGNNASHWAAKYGHTCLIETLLDAGVDVNLRNHNDDTIDSCLNKRADLEIQQNYKSYIKFVSVIIKIDCPPAYCSNRLITLKILSNKSAAIKIFKSHWVELWSKTSNREIMKSWSGSQKKVSGNREVDITWDIWWRQIEPSMADLVTVLSNYPAAFEIATSYMLMENISISQLISALTDDSSDPEFDIVMEAASNRRFKCMFKLVYLVLETIQEKHPIAYMFFHYVTYFANTDVYFNSNKILKFMEISARERIECFKILRKYSLLELGSISNYIYYYNEDITDNGMIEMVRYIFLVKKHNIEKSHKILQNFFNFYINKNTFNIEYILNVMNVQNIKSYYLINYKKVKPSIIKKLKKSGLNIDSLDGWNALHLASADRRYIADTVVRRLIRLNEDVNESINGITPLDVAVAINNKWISTVETLIRAGAKHNSEIVSDTS